MTAITGSNSKAGMKVTGTWGTAATLTTGDLLAGNTINHSENTDELTVPAIGYGFAMKSISDRGGIDPTISIDGPLGYNEPKALALAQLFGANSIVTATAGAYEHSFMYNAYQTKYVTVAMQGHSASAGTFEYPSATVTEATVAGTARPEYITCALSLLADQQKIASQTNTFTTFDTVTQANGKRVPFEFADEFWIGPPVSTALTNANRLNITSFSISYKRPQESPNEAKGSAGNGTPVAVGEYPFMVTLQVVCRKMDDFTYFTAHQADTRYKAVLIKNGSTLVSPYNYRYRFFFPYLRLATPPENQLQEGGFNPLTLTFEALVSPSNWADMPSIYPFITLMNDKAAVYLT